ncbi:MAG: hypothetical protein R3B53_00480 [Candidatus Paceibacterota bacterium]
MKKTVVTAGAKNADIDVLGCVVAYAELLRLEGVESVPVVPGKFTMSVTPSILSLGFIYENDYQSDGEENFVLVDISDYEHFPDFVDLGNVTEVYDHRYGHEEYWREKLGSDSHIEIVGACGTLIWEQFKKRGKAGEISVTSATLLLASIVSNNLNFKSTITTERDKIAFAELKEIVKVPDNWVEEYFAEQESILLGNFEEYLVADTKVFRLNTENFAIGQIELWDAEKVIETKINTIEKVMGVYEPIPWVVNIINISKGFNYIYSSNEGGKGVIEKCLGVTFSNDLAKTDGLVLRKQLMKVIKGGK